LRPNFDDDGEANVNRVNAGATIAEAAGVDFTVMRFLDGLLANEGDQLLGDHPSIEVDHRQVIRVVRRVAWPISSGTSAKNWGAAESIRGATAQLDTTRIAVAFGETQIAVSDAGSLRANLLGSRECAFALATVPSDPSPGKEIL
jgi:hypothetical protein